MGSKMFKVDYIIAWFTLVSGLCISGVAVYYSVAGLMSIFAAAAIPIMVMGTFLETSKLIATLWLKRYWNVAPFVIKSYLSAAVVILMLITSMGIYGYLSRAHSSQSVPTGEIVAKVEFIDSQIKTEQDNILVAKKSLSQLDDAVNQTMSRSSDEKGATSAIYVRRSQTKERAALNAEIVSSQAEIAKLNKERIPVASELRTIESEVGPIRYIAALMYGDNMDPAILEKAVRAVIILIVIVFDPLAVILLLASQYSFDHIKRQQETAEPTHEEILEEDEFKIKHEQNVLEEKMVELAEVQVEQKIAEIEIAPAEPTAPQVIKRKSYPQRGIRPPTKPDSG